MDISKKVIEIAIDVERKWNEYKGNIGFPESIWKKGFAVFYSPVKMNPEFLIIGDNPGGDEKTSKFHPKNSIRIPSEHEYFTEDYFLADRMRKIFEKADLKNQLRNSVKINRIFFRSINLKEFENVNVYDELKSYCYLKIKEIILLLKPQIIFAESLESMRVILKLLEEIKGNGLNYKIAEVKIMSLRITLFIDHIELRISSLKE